MEDRRNIIGHGQGENGSKWYVVSDRDPKTGKIWARAGQKVTVAPNAHCDKCNESYCDHLDTLRELENVLEPEAIDAIKEKLPWLKFAGESYSCSCIDFRETREKCVHILSVEHFQEELRTEPKEGLITQRAQEIESLKRKIEELESEKTRYLGEKESHDEEIQGLRSALEDKEAESQQIIEILEEEIAQAAQEKQKAVSIAEGLRRKRFTPLYDLPEETQTYILFLAELEPEKIKETLGSVIDPVIYQRIPHSKTSRKDKIALGKREHHRPRQFEEFVQRTAGIDTIDLITCSWDESAKDTRVKGVYPPGWNLPNGQKNNCWTIHMVYSGGDFGANLYLQTTARSKLEAELIKREIESKIQ